MIGSDATRRSGRPGLRPAGAWLMLVLVCAGFSLSPRFARTFWTASYLPTVLQQAATNIIVAVGMTFVILTGGIDLSSGSVLAISGVALGLTVKSGPPPFLAVLMAAPAGAAAFLFLTRRTDRVAAGLAAAALVPAAGAWMILRLASGGIRLEWAVLGALAVGAGCGCLNGLGVALGRVPPFVMTLGMLTAARGLTVYSTDGNSVSGLPVRLGALGEGLPVVSICLATTLLGALLLRRTRAGRHQMAVGGGEEAARLSGLDVARVKVLAYLLSGLSAAVAAVVLTAKFRVADTGAGVNAELNGIAAVVIGGTPLRGGEGSVVGSLVGAVTIAVLNAGLVLVGVRDTLQGVVIGLVIVVTVMLDRRAGE